MTFPVVYTYVIVKQQGDHKRHAPAQYLFYVLCFSNHNVLGRSHVLYNRHAKISERVYSGKEVEGATAVAINVWIKKSAH